jgi:hypothetical protein
MPFISSVRGNYGPLKKTQVAGDPELKFRITGGNSITVAGGYRIHTFTGPGTWDSTQYQYVQNVEYLVLAGGGGGGPRHGGGGGGAGGYQQSNINVPGTSHGVTRGAAGSGQFFPSTGTPGSPSSWFTITSTGGGRGAGYHDSNSEPGGSGGGAGGPPVTAHRAGGGGGAGGAGGNSNGPAGVNPGSSPTRLGIPGQGNPGGLGHNEPGGTGGTGGAGANSSITGSPVVRAGGGGGAAWTGTPGPGGPGGGGNSAGSGGGDGQPATTSNSGSGGGGGNGNPTRGGDGSDGLVVIRYII